MLNLELTKKALEIYDIEHKKFQALPINADHGNALEELEDKEKLVKIAFYHETSHINSKEDCMLLKVGPSNPQNKADLSFLRRMVKTFEQGN